jgi:transposase-like protein
MMRVATQPPSVQSVREVAQDVQGAVRREISAPPSRTEAIRRFRAWRAKWLDEAEAAVRCLEKDLFHCFRYYHFPQHLWKTIRTANIVERAFREVRRRRRPKGRIHQRRVGGTDHVRGNRASQRELAGASPSANSIERLT